MKSNSLCLHNFDLLWLHFLHPEPPWDTELSDSLDYSFITFSHLHMPDISWCDSSGADSKAIAACAWKAPSSQTCYLIFLPSSPWWESPGLYIHTLVPWLLCCSLCLLHIKICRFLFQSKKFFSQESKQKRWHENKIFVKQLGFILFEPLTRKISKC